MHDRDIDGSGGHAAAKRRVSRSRQFRRGHRIPGPAPHGEERRLAGLGRVQHHRRMPDGSALRLFYERPRRRGSTGCRRSAASRVRGRMIVIAIVTARPQHQQAQQKIIAGKEAARADDFGPAVIGDEALAQQRIGIGSMTGAIAGPPRSRQWRPPDRARAAWPRRCIAAGGATPASVEARAARKSLSLERLFGHAFEHERRRLRRGLALRPRAMAPISQRALS